MLSMKELAACLESANCRNVKTYIQSGNAVFRSVESNASVLSERIVSAMRATRGFGPQVVLLTVQALEKAVAANPFPEAETAPKTLHLNFLASVPGSAGVAALAGLKAASERFVLDGAVFYLHAPEGIGRSKLAAAVEKCLGVSGTMRNWRTVCEILKMAST